MQDGDACDIIYNAISSSRSNGTSEQKRYMLQVCKLHSPNHAPHPSHRLKLPQPSAPHLSTIISYRTTVSARSSHAPTLVWTHLLASSTIFSLRSLRLFSRFSLLTSQPVSFPFPFPLLNSVASSTSPELSALISVKRDCNPSLAMRDIGFPAVAVDERTAATGALGVGAGGKIGSTKNPAGG